jgi:RimJ/RimL family protein N-acetyltransferase
MTTNEFGRPVGRDLGDWTPPPMIPHEVIEGVHVTLRPLEPDHAVAVYEALAAAPDDLWTYMPWGPFRSADELRELFENLLALPDWRPYAIEVDGVLEGFHSYLRINPGDGVIEIGSIVFSPRLQRTTAATESIFLLIKHAFENGYRRVEWKCDDLNAPSRRSGERFGFRYEGTFRNATHYKGRNRDTAWFAITAEDWPALGAAYEAWLDPANFDAAGNQIKRLNELRG